MGIIILPQRQGLEMSSKAVPFFCLFFVLCVSCIGQKFDNTVHLCGNVAYEDVDVYMFVSASEDSITVFNYQDSLFFTTYYNGGKQKFLRRGRGLYEVMNPLCFALCGDDLVIVDHSGLSAPSKLITVNLRTPNDYSSWTINDISWIGSARPICSIIRLTQTSYLTTSGRYSSGTALSFLDTQDKVFEPIDFRVPLVTKSSLFVQDAVLASSAITRNAISNSLFGYSCGEGKYLEIVELNNNHSVKKRSVVLNIPPKFDEDSKGSYKMRDRTNRGIRVKSTSNHIFAFYNHPIELQDYKGYPTYYNDYLDVFDWEGKFIERIVFDEPFSDFIVTPNDRVIYTSTINLNTFMPIIKKYHSHLEAT